MHNPSSFRWLLAESILPHHSFSKWVLYSLTMLICSCQENVTTPKSTPEASAVADTTENAFSTGNQNTLTDPILSDIETLIRYGYYTTALEIITEQLRAKPQEDLLRIRTLLFLKAGQPELAALSSAEYAKVTNKPFANDLIDALLHQEEIVRLNALQALEIAEDPRRFEAVMPLAVTDESPLIRLAALRLLQKSDDAQLKKTFFALARDPSAFVRAEAIDALTRWGDAETRAAIWRATEDEDPLVRKRARAAIAKLFSPEHLEEYRRMASGENKKIAVAAALALASSGLADGADILIESLLNSPDVTIRRDAARALGRIPVEDPTQLLNALHTALAENDSRLRSIVLDSLEALSDTRSIEPLSQFANDPLVPAALSRRAFEIVRSLRATLTKRNSPSPQTNTVPFSQQNNTTSIPIQQTTPQ